MSHQGLSDFRETLAPITPIIGIIELTVPMCLVDRFKPPPAMESLDSVERDDGMVFSTSLSTFSNSDLSLLGNPVFLRDSASLVSGS